MASAVARAYNATPLGGLPPDPPAVSRGRAPGQEGQGGEAPVKLKHFWFLDVQRKPQICPLFYSLEMQRNKIFVLSLQKISGDHETGGGCGAKLGLCPPGPGLKPPLVI